MDVMGTHLAGHRKFEKQGEPINRRGRSFLLLNRACLAIHYPVGAQQELSPTLDFFSRAVGLADL